jgi:hypothetical protein
MGHAIEVQQEVLGCFAAQPDADNPNLRTDGVRFR